MDPDEGKHAGGIPGCQPGAADGTGATVMQNAENPCVPADPESPGVPPPLPNVRYR